jgi:hypothetical protein
MEIQALRLLITEATANELVKRHLPEAGAVEGLRVRLTPEGVVVQGEYPTFMMKMAFETLWELAVSGPELVARLASARVAGLPANIFKGALMKMVRDAASQGPGVRVSEDAIFLNVEQAAGVAGAPLRVRFTAVRCSIGALVLEAGSAFPGG